MLGKVKDGGERNGGRAGTGQQRDEGLDTWALAHGGRDPIPVYVRKTIPGIWLFLGNFTAFISKQIKAVIAGEMILIGP